MPFCKHGEPDHKCAVCQAARRPDGVAVLDASKAADSPAPITSLSKPVVQPTLKFFTPVVTPKVNVQSRLPGPLSSVLVNAVSRAGPVSSGALPIPINPAIRGGGVSVNDLVVQEFWRTYRLLEVTDKTAEAAIAAAIVQSQVPVVEGFDTLEFAEKYALYKYTSVEYAKWNDFLRNKKGNYKSHCALVSSALGKLKSEPEYATTYRIEKFSEGRHGPFFSRRAGQSGTLTVGTEISFDAFSSTAYNVAIVEADPQFSGAGSYVKYIITKHVGKRVNFLSTKSVECEILIDKGAKFRITGGPGQKFVFDSVRRSGAIEINIEQVV
jgi:hypothetical protein